MANGQDNLAAILSRDMTRSICLAARCDNMTRLMEELIIILRSVQFMSSKCDGSFVIHCQLPWLDQTGQLDQGERQDWINWFVRRAEAEQLSHPARKRERENLPWHLQSPLHLWLWHGFQWSELFSSWLLPSMSIDRAPEPEPVPLVSPVPRSQRRQIPLRATETRLRNKQSADNRCRWSWSRQKK